MKSLQYSSIAKATEEVRLFPSKQGKGRKEFRERYHI